jgi:non-canonical (house-cleaning) NTP pyrophosphatase
MNDQDDISGADPGSGEQRGSARVSSTEPEQVRELWRALQHGVEVTVASEAADRLLGVRDGFRRYLRSSGPGTTPIATTPIATTPIAVVPQHFDEPASGLPLDDASTVELALSKARALREALGGSYHFYVATEGGLQTITLDGRSLHFIRNWTVVLGAIGEACGCSGSVQLPERLVAALDEPRWSHGEPAMAVPGTRRRGGIISSLTHGVENRRSTVTQSTFNALCSLFYGVIERPSAGGR